jgi:2-polyprenyl-3-methyl-5-hydroxy-6-metoxy-1,4-benzoquinol methylase
MSVAKIREVSADDLPVLETIADIHIRFSPDDPLCHLGKYFIREICYREPLKKENLRVVLYELNGQAAGFAAFTIRSKILSKQKRGQNFLFFTWALIVSVIQDPRRLTRLNQVFDLFFFTSPDSDLEHDHFGEVIMLAVHLENTLVLRNHSMVHSIMENLLRHISVFLHRAGIDKLRVFSNSRRGEHHHFYRSKGSESPSNHLWGDACFWISLKGDHLTLPQPIPDIWSHGQGKKQNSDGGWIDYWEDFGGGTILIKIEAEDYVNRLTMHIEGTAKHQVLDFGCGYGYVAELLAEHVENLWLWDAASSVRSQARIYAAKFPNIHFFDFSDPEILPDNQFDLILCHSIIQYMSDEEIQSTLSAWSRIITFDGQILLSDVIPDRHEIIPELISIVGFSLQKGIFLRMIWHGFLEFLRHLGVRNSRPLTTVQKAVMENWAAEAGLTANFLPENLSYRGKRYTVLLKKKG